MDELLDKLILLGLCSFLILDEKGTAPILSLLAAITAAALGYSIGETKKICLVFAALFFISLWQNAALLFFPVFLYDMIHKKIYASSLPFLLLFAASHNIDWTKTAFFLALALLSVLLAQKTTKKQELSTKLIQLRDSSVELNLMLQEKNRTLLEKQDYEIHLATLKERNRIAREIHDNVGHMLSRSILMTGALLTVEKEGAAYHGLLGLKDTLSQAMDSIRQSVHDLHDDSIDLRQAAHEIAEPMRQAFDVTLEYDMSEAIPRRVKYCLIATAKEAASNILKHSNGDSVTVSFQEHPAFYRLSIKDNGTAAADGMGHGIGLSNMKERARMLGGTFQIHVNNEFSILLTIPKTEETVCG